MSQVSVGPHFWDRMMSVATHISEAPYPAVDAKSADDLAALNQSPGVPAGIGAAKFVAPRPTDAVPNPPSELTSTVDLVARVRSGDQDALEVVCVRCLKGLRCFAAGRVPPRIRGMLDTQDLVAEALEKGLARLLDLDLVREGALMAYLRRVLKNLIVDKIRAADRAPTSTCWTTSTSTTRSRLSRGRSTARKWSCTKRPSSV